jgi:hypothetical protein
MLPSVITPDILPAEPIYNINLYTIDNWEFVEGRKGGSIGGEWEDRIYLRPDGV